jgi:hypothetical protein
MGEEELDLSPLFCCPGPMSLKCLKLDGWKIPQAEAVVDSAWVLLSVVGLNLCTCEPHDAIATYLEKLPSLMLVAMTA